MSRLSIILAAAALVIGCLDLAVSGRNGRGSEQSGSGSGGSTSAGGGSSGSSTGAPRGICGEIPKLHRPAAVRCDGGNATPPPWEPDAGNLCEQDSDCHASDAGLVCSCAPATGVPGDTDFSVNECVPGNCQVDSDCSCGYCSPSDEAPCGTWCGVVGYFCRTAADTCTNDGDCDAGPNWKEWGYCGYSRQVAHWACGYNFFPG
jgi:hypothetical protein